jgi:WD40 repeat protein
LGGGGFARTYLAEDTQKLNERCVIKQLVPNVQSTKARHKATELFQQEAQRLQQLGNHPQIPTLYAYFEQEGYLYLAQQFISGSNLLEELERHGEWNELKIRALLSDVLRILQFVHEQQVIHRDIKPENIIRYQSQTSTLWQAQSLYTSSSTTTGSLALQPSPSLSSVASAEHQLVLIDFGVAKHLTNAPAVERGTTIGSLGYAPFEQLKEGEAYPASDLYSLGVTCFHLLTRTHPWELWTEQGYGWVSNWRQHLQYPISQQMEWILNKLLQKDWEKRYQSASEALRDLQDWESHPRPIQNTPSPIPSGTGNNRTTNRRVKAFSLVPLLFWRSSSQNRWLLVSIVLILSFGIYESWQFQGQLVAKTSSEEQKTVIQTLVGHSGVVRAVAISPDGQLLASGSEDNTIKIWQLKTGRLVRTLIGHTNWISSLAITPDGQMLVSASGDSTIKIWQLKTGQLVRTLSSHTNSVYTMAISSDGQTIASGSGDNTIKIWQLKTGQLVRTLTRHSYAVNSLAISPDGQTLVSGNGSVWPLGEDYTIKIWQFKTGIPQRTLTGHLANVAAIAISPDGQTLISGSDDQTIKVWQLSTGKLIHTLSGHSNRVYALAISPDGQTLVSGSGDNTIKVWNLKTGNLIRTLTGHSSAIYALAMSADGKTLVSGSDDKTIKIWRILR